MRSARPTHEMSSLHALPRGAPGRTPLGRYSHARVIYRRSLSGSPATLLAPPAAGAARLMMMARSRPCASVWTPRPAWRESQDVGQVRCGRVEVIELSVGICRTIINPCKRARALTCEGGAKTQQKTPSGQGRKLWPTNCPPGHQMDKRSNCHTPSRLPIPPPSAANVLGTPHCEQPSHPAQKTAAGCGGPTTEDHSVQSRRLVHRPTQGSAIQWRAMKRLALRQSAALASQAATPAAPRPTTTALLACPMSKRSHSHWR